MDRNKYLTRLKRQFNWNNNDCLFIKKESSIITSDEIRSSCRNSWWFKYKAAENLLIVDDYGDECVYNGQETRIIYDFLNRLKYAGASLHDDRLINEAVNSVLPEIEEVIFPAKRYTNKDYLKYWMMEYDFTLKDFLFDNKYIVVSDIGNMDNVYNLSDLGLLSLEKMSVCSEYEGNLEELCK